MPMHGMECNVRTGRKGGGGGVSVTSARYREEEETEKKGGKGGRVVASPPFQNGADEIAHGEGDETDLSPAVDTGGWLHIHNDGGNVVLYCLLYQDGYSLGSVARQQRRWRDWHADPAFQPRVDERPSECDTVIYIAHQRSEPAQCQWPAAQSTRQGHLQYN